jgi:hypothetical protein
VDIVRALNDNNVFARHFRGESWTAWRVFLAALFGLPLGHDQHLLFRQFTGRSVAPTEACREAWLVVGRRGGKSFVLALIAVFLACFKDWKPYLGPGEVATVMILARDRAQARGIKRFVSGLLRETPMLSPLLEDETAESIRLTNRVVVEIHTASFKTVRGYTIVAALCDELAFWESDEAAAEPDVEILNALKPAMATIPGSVLLCASSPHARRGALWEAHRKHFGQDGDPILVWQAATRAMNPSVPQSYIDRHTADDPARAQAEYGAQFRTDVETFISREVVDAAVVPGRQDLPRMEGVRYTGFVDPSGGSSDAMTLSICHVETDMGGPPRAVIDLVREVKPPFSLDGLVAEFAALLKAYGISAVWGDRYAGIWPRERFAVHGINYQVPKQSASDLYTALLPVLNSHRVELPDNPRLISQLCQLERHAGSTKDNVRHPPGGHDDVANAVAGAVVMALAAAVRDKAIPMVTPVVVSSGARYFPGSDTYTGAGVPATPSGSPAYNYDQETSWRSWVNSDGSIRGSRRNPWDI